MTAATGSEIPIEAPRLQEPVTGLLAQVPTITGPEADRWLRGVAFGPEGAGEPEFADLCSTVPLLGTANRISLRQAQPFELVFRDRCSSWGWTENDYEGRATRALAVKRHWALEREFEKGALVAANLNLAETYAGPDPITVTLASGASVSAVNALALLDEAIANSANVIGRGMIHATAYVVAQWKAAGLLNTETVEGDEGLGISSPIYSPKGNWIIAGNGYEGRGPDGAVVAAHAAQWAYATDMVVVVASDPETIPSTLGEATDKSTNTVVFRQHQWFAVLWPALLHAAVKVATDVSESVTAVGGLTNSQLRASAVPVTAAPSNGTLTDRSGAVTAGGTAQALAAANANRKYLLIINPIDATAQGIATAEALYINFTTTAVVGSPSIRLDPGAVFVMESGYVCTEAISVIAATTAHKWTAKESS